MENFWFNLIKDYYNLKLYNNEDLDLFVKVKYITEEQKLMIVNNNRV
ncbi:MULTISPECIES: XkdX family protein [unclassified Clostridium]|nr:MULTISPECIES: XkdX family protein [unclassified Clostridium]NFN94937.1 XkdX family protein [Clostridium botulinum]NFS29026.1 XkdX family protein [Clostridium botulinum]NFS52932.1 XkdX family protein [Clostridium botulinum]NFS95838.1 XkdX family protein [Clostridium botulinum]NFT16454.1 XkdX family protein [Clostridium botulinum]